MALIRTLYGDTESDVTYTKAFQAVGQITFDLSLADPRDAALLGAGAFNAWRPLAIRIQDGNANQGGSMIDIAAWSVVLNRTDDTVTVTAYDAAKWFERRSAARVSAAAQSVGLHVLDLFANVIENREERPAGSLFHNETTTSDSAWFYYQVDGLGHPVLDAAGNPLEIVHDLSVPMGTVWASVKSLSASHTAANRRGIFAGFKYSTNAAPLSVKIRLWAYTAPGPTWSNTVEVSVDSGVTWGAPFHVDPIPSLAMQWIDITADHTWTAADVTSGQIMLRFTVQTASDGTSDERWNIFYVGVQCDFATDISDNWPVRVAQVDPGGPVISLPAGRKPFLDWLTYLTGQGAGEWTVQSDFNQLGSAGLAWQQRLGTDFHATITDAYGTRPYASLEEGQLVTRVTKSNLDGAAIYSQVRATASGLGDVVATNAALAEDIGVHEFIDDLGDGATAAAQQAEAATKLAEVGNPSIAFTFEMPRLAGLWAALELGTTAITTVAQAPIFPWSGIVRILNWNLDEDGGTLAIDVLSVQDAPNSSQAVGSGHQVQATASARKATPQQRERNRFLDVQTLLRRLVRS